MPNIIRVQKSKNFVVVSRDVLNDTKLSWKAKGILVYMLSMPDDWTFYIDELVKHASDGKDSFRSGFNELKKHGYVERRAVRDEKTKRITAWETIVHERPMDLQAEQPYVDEPKQEKLQLDMPHVENPPLLNTNNNQKIIKRNIDSTNTEPFATCMANLLLSKIQADVPTFRVPNLHAWATHITHMRADGLSEAQIEQLIHWATSHHFWKPYIISPKKLREKATTLLLQMNAGVVEQQSEVRTEQEELTEEELEVHRERVRKKLGIAP